MTYGVQPAAAEFHETALTVMRMRDSSEVWYGPFDTETFDQIRIRYKPLAPGILNVVVARDTTALNLADGRALPELPQAKVLDRILAEGNGHVIERLQRSAYQGWRELVVPIDQARSSVVQPGFPSLVKLVILSEAAGVVAEIDALMLEDSGATN